MQALLTSEIAILEIDWPLKCEINPWEQLEKNPFNSQNFSVS